MKFVIGFLVTIGLLVVVFILIFRGAGGSADDSAAKALQLKSYADTSTVMQFIDKGPVSSNQKHYETRVTVSNKEASVELFEGYDYQLVDSKTYPTNTASYADFLSALQRAGYMNGDKKSKKTDDSGACASGHRYVMTIKTGTKENQRFWSSSCGNLGNFQGKVAGIRALFMRQIPDYSKYSRS